MKGLIRSLTFGNNFYVRNLFCDQNTFVSDEQVSSEEEPTEQEE
jgi:hypothetical protein